MVNKFFSLLLLLFISPVWADGKLDYSIEKGQFKTSLGVIPAGCIGQLQTQLNGDNTVAAIFVNDTDMQGCINSNDPYPVGDESRVKYDILTNFGKNRFLLRVCEAVDGSMGASCGRIVVGFTMRPYITAEGKKEVLSLEKLGEFTEVNEANDEFMDEFMK